MTDIAPKQATQQEIWPTYALRAWLTALQAQTRRAQEDLQSRIDSHEKEIARLRRQHERAATVLNSLQGTIDQVDGRLRQVRDSDSFAKAAGAQPTPKEPVPEPEQQQPERDETSDPSQARGGGSRARPR